MRVETTFGFGGGGCSFSLILAHGEERSAEERTGSQGRTQGGKKRKVMLSSPKLWLRTESREKRPHVSATGDWVRAGGQLVPPGCLGGEERVEHIHAQTHRGFRSGAAPARQPGSKNQERCLSTGRQHLSPPL